MRQLLTAIVAITATTLGIEPGLAQQTAWGTTAPANIEDARQQLFKLVEIHESLLSSYETLGGEAPHLHLAIQREYSLVSRMTAEQLQALVDAQLPLNEVMSELEFTVAELQTEARAYSSASPVPSIAFSPATAFDPAPQTEGAPHLGDDCAADDDQILDSGERGIRLPAGPCNQIDEIPTQFNTNDGSRVLAEFRLSDVQYPFICPINTPAAIVVGYEVTFNGLRFLASLAKPVCDQEAAGFNTAAACIPFVLGVELADEILGFPKYCNGVRRNSDGTAIYIRTGEIFVQSNAHYRALDARSSETESKIGELETNVSAEVELYGSEVSAELDEGFGAVEARMDILEQRILENQKRTDFARLNNDEILREIRIQKARDLDDLLGFKER